jgi:hypothetical protein
MATGETLIDRLITDDELEALLRVHAGWAAKDRCGKARIPWCKIGKSVRYRTSDVRAFIDQNMKATAA